MGKQLVMGITFNIHMSLQNDKYISISSSKFTYLQAHLTSEIEKKGNTMKRNHKDYKLLT